MQINKKRVEFILKEEYDFHGFILYFICIFIHVKIRIYFCILLLLDYFYELAANSLLQKMSTPVLFDDEFHEF